METGSRHVCSIHDGRKVQYCISFYYINRENVVIYFRKTQSIRKCVEMNCWWEDWMSLCVCVFSSLIVCVWFSPPESFQSKTKD